MTGHVLLSPVYLSSNSPTLPSPIESMAPRSDEVCENCRRHSTALHNFAHECADCLPASTLAKCGECDLVRYCVRMHVASHLVGSLMCYFHRVENVRLPIVQRTDLRAKSTRRLKHSRRLLAQRLPPAKPSSQTGANITAVKLRWQQPFQ